LKSKKRGPSPSLATVFSLPTLSEFSCAAGGSLPQREEKVNWDVFDAFLVCHPSFPSDPASFVSVCDPTSILPGTGTSSHFLRFVGVLSFNHFWLQSFLVLRGPVTPLGPISLLSGFSPELPWRTVTNLHGSGVAFLPGDNSKTGVFVRFLPTSLPRAYGLPRFLFPGGSARASNIRGYLFSCFLLFWLPRFLLLVPFPSPFWSDRAFCATRFATVILRICLFLCSSPQSSICS